MDTKTKGEIAELSVIKEGLRRGYQVFRPVVDKGKYDVIFERNGKFAKIQIKSAWVCGNRYVVSTKKTRTNRREIKVTRYTKEDFDFAILFIEDHNLFYVLPSKIFVSSLSLTLDIEGTCNKGRRSSTQGYKERWDIIDKFFNAEME